MANEKIGDSQSFWAALSRYAGLLAGTFLDRKKIAGPGLVGGAAGEVMLDPVQHHFPCWPAHQARTRDLLTI